MQIVAKRGDQLLIMKDEVAHTGFIADAVAGIILSPVDDLDVFLRAGYWEDADGDWEPTPDPPIDYGSF